MDIFTKFNGKYPVVMKPFRSGPTNRPNTAIPTATSLARLKISQLNVDILAVVQEEISWIGKSWSSVVLRKFNGPLPNAF